MYSSDDKRNTLWSLLQEQSNRKCMDCTAQNPSFACPALGTFVCVRCAELLREFGVQVKSVVSSSFSEEEIKYLLQQGNAVARHRWLARWTPAEFPEPSHEDPNRVRQFMVLKYREKKWASAATNLVNPIYEDQPAKLVDVSPFMPKPLQQMQERASFEFASPTPTRKDLPAGYTDPYRSTGNPFSDPPTFTPIMSPPNHPQSPPPQDPVTSNPFIRPSSPSQIYLSSPPTITTPHTTPHPTPHTSSLPNPNQLQPHPLTLNPASPQSMSPPLPNVVLSTPLPTLNGITSPINSPLVTPNPPPQMSQLNQPTIGQPTQPLPAQPLPQPLPPTSNSSSTPSSHAPPLSRASSSDDTTSRMLEEVKTLKQLYEMQMMGKEEYEARRIQLIDSLTKTTHATNNSNPTPAVVEPRLAGTERAIRHRFDVKKGKWCHTATIVIIEQNPFAEGAMRKAYRMRDLSQEGQLSLMVAKIFRDPNEERASYFKDVEMQMQAKEVADRFNRRAPPKKVDFVSAFVYELVDRPNKQICSAEYYIDGKFEKHNNNFGYINDDTDRNTPQVFSHFSYEDSNGQLIVVDIQGVGDVYTDPQIHTLDGQGFGRGNLGAEGINKFFSTHACNQICHFFGLTAVNPKQPLTDAGTKPQSGLKQSSSNVDRFDFRGDVFDVLHPQTQQAYNPRN